MRTSTRRRLGVIASLVTAVVCLTGTLSPAHAAQGVAPVAVADRFTMQAESMQEIDVLGNDSDADGDALAVCRVEGAPRNVFVIAATATGGPLAGGSESALVVMALRPGTYTFRYFACDRHHLSAPATVTVKVTPAPKLSLAVTEMPRHPGKIKVTNRGKLGFHFMWGSYKEDEPDGIVFVKSRSTKIITVKRRSIIWVAENGRTGAARQGIKRGIRLPKGTKALAPGAPPRGSGMDEVLGRAHAWLP